MITVATTPTTTVSRDLHVFHYATHSVVETILICRDNECVDQVAPLPHLHTPAGHDLFRTVNTYPTSDGAERFVQAMLRDADQHATPGTVTVIRHAAQPPRYAIKIDANHDGNGNPRRGWLIYSAAGAFLGFIDEGYRGPPHSRRSATSSNCTPSPRGPASTARPPPRRTRRRTDLHKRGRQQSPAVDAPILIGYD